MNNKTKNRAIIIIIALIVITSIIMFKPSNEVKFSTLAIVPECRYDGETCGQGVGSCCDAFECKNGGCVLKKQVCGTGDYEGVLCTEPLFNSYDPEGIYCNVGSWIGCPDGCVNDICSGSPIECTDGYMECRGDSVYKCITGKWTKTEDCETSCTNPQYNRAFCTYRIYYCKQSDRNECPEYDTKQSNLQCFDSLEQCKGSYGFCCKSGSGVYTWRTGLCESSETPFSGTAYNQKYCEDQNIPDITECASCDAYVISNIFGGFMQDKKCIPHKGGFIEAYVFKLFEFLFIDTPLDVKFPQNNTTCSFSYLKFALVILVFIFSVLFGIDFLEKFNSLKGKKRVIPRILVSVVIGLILAYLVYTSFWIGLILSIGLLTGYIFVKFKLWRYL